MKKLWYKLILSGVAGGLLGYAYYYFIGCRSGSCPLTTNPWITTGYGLLVGLVVGWDVRLLRRKNQQNPLHTDKDSV